MAGPRIKDKESGTNRGRRSRAGGAGKAKTKTKTKDTELVDNLTESESRLEGTDDADAGAPASTADETDTPKFGAGEVSQGDMDATRLYLNEIGFSPLLTAAE